MDGEPRRGTAADLDRVTEIITASFRHDPVWSWMLPDPGHGTGRASPWWRLYVRGALGHGWVWLTDGDEAASVWLPPGAPELPPEDEVRVLPVLVELVGAARAGTVMEALDRFDAAHPHDEAHFYLSLVGTHPDHRGHGFGMGLLAANLALIDREHIAAYLESTTPTNLHRYERLGFEVRGAFELPAGGPTVTTMWRPAR